MASETSDFQRAFLSKGTGNKLFTQTEFDESLRLAQAEIMTVAVDATKQAILIERDACAHLVHEMVEKESNEEIIHVLKEVVKAILNRIPVQRQ